ASGVRLRFEDILETMHRELAGKKVIAVTHGETMEVARFVLERLLPEEWQQQEEGEDFKFSNCQILHYTRTNPSSGEQSSRLEWRRSICAGDESRSWNNGEWVHIERHRYNDGELLGLAEHYP